ncbi:Nuclear transcription factor Y subunit B-6 [Triticum urartu]|uniref:Nuclear transcription factor Y subunit B-6 n=1 Tax=Triticum urartu TaxID=4572 RepID=M7ZF84_TRIUA|nr:Nuclear transcription factor Y subunit B-6 [Triticum urartu]
MENDGVPNGPAAPAPTQATPVVREQDRLMPIANVIRIMRRALPAHAKISDEAKEAIQECVSEFISFVTGEANERCRMQRRKAVNAEDIVWALNRLGFDDYVVPLSVFLKRMRDPDAGTVALEVASLTTIVAAPAPIPAVARRHALAVVVVPSTAVSTLPCCPLRRRHEQLLTPALAAVLSTAPNPLIERTQPPERFVERHRRHVVELLDAGDDGEEAIRHRIQQLLDKCCVASVSPRLAYLAAIDASLPPYTSSSSPSAIFIRSNSPRSVSSLAARTRSAPTNLTFTESHTSLTVSFVDTCSSTSSGNAPRSNARAILSFLAFTVASPSVTASHTVQMQQGIYGPRAPVHGYAVGMAPVRANVGGQYQVFVGERVMGQQYYGYGEGAYGAGSSNGGAGIGDQESSSNGVPAPGEGKGEPEPEPTAEEPQDKPVQSG